MDQLKVAIVGAGKVAQNSYLPYLGKEPGVALGYLGRTHAKADAAARSSAGRPLTRPRR